MKPDTESFYELAVQKAAERVVANLDEALDLHALARSAALSPFHFHRIFRGLLGETPLELHRRLRLERAAWSLLHQDLPITTVAFAAGYETHESFTRAFRSHYQCSPSEFRSSRLRASACAPAYKFELACRSGIHFTSDGVSSLVIQFAKGDQLMDVKIVERQELRVATVTHIGPYNRISEAFARLGQLAGPAGLYGPQGAMIGIYHDDPETTAPSELRSEAGLVVAPDARIPEGLQERRVAAGRYAMTTHLGPHERLGDTWARLMGEWLPRSGERMTDGVSYEIYRNTPENTPKDQLATELYIPLV